MTVEQATEDLVNFTNRYIMIITWNLAKMNTPI